MKDICKITKAFKSVPCSKYVVVLVDKKIKCVISIMSYTPWNYEEVKFENLGTSLRLKHGRHLDSFVEKKGGGSAIF